MTPPSQLTSRTPFSREAASVLQAVLADPHATLDPRSRSALENLLTRATQLQEPAGTGPANSGSDLAAAAVRESEERLRLALDAGEIGIWDWDIPTNCVTWSDKVYEFHGLHPDEFDGQVESFCKLVHPEDFPRVGTAIQHALESGEPYVSEMRICRPDGQERWILTHGRVLHDGSGQPVRMLGATVDITAHKQTEKTLQATHDTFRHLVEHSPFGVYVVNSDFLLVQVSAGAQKVFETIRPLIGRDFADIVRKIWPEPFATEAINRFRHTLDTGEPYAAPRVMERRQDIGEIESYDWRIERLMLPDGRFGVVCHFYDLSERLRYETALREGEERYRQLFEANPHPMWIFDGETLGFLAVNDAAMRQYGYTREEFLGMTIAEIHASGGEGGWRHRRKDGTEIDVEIDSHALNFAGRSARVVLAHDVTQRKHAEDALRTSEDRHRRLLEEASDGIMSVDLQGRFIMANAAACRLLGYTNDEICRLTLADTYCPEEAHLGMDRLRQAVIGGNLRFERQVRRKDGVYFTAEFCITVLPNQVIYGIFRDVTERKQLEVRLEQTVAERTARLQETLGELEAFSYSISHDLRAPLRTMSGYARVLIEDAGHKLAPEEIKHLERILRAATRLDRLINDVLDYSRLSRAEVSVVPVELEKIVDDVLQQYPAVNSHVASILVCRPLPCALGHEALLVQCVSNLLANAFKFMRPGVAPVVEIWAEIGETSVNLHVRDNGIGIAPHNLSRIFGLFQRINAAHAYEGMGIGLTIVKKAVERLGGKVRVQSIEGEGSTFSLELGKLPS